MRRVPCPKCGKRLKYKDELIGKRVKCPRCATIFRVKPEPLSEQEIENEVLDLLDDESWTEDVPSEERQ